MQAKLLDTLLDIIAVHAGQYSILHGLHYLTKVRIRPELGSRAHTSVPHPSCT